MSNTLKVVTAKRTCGPVSVKERKSLSAAVHKVMFNNDLKVEIISEATKKKVANENKINNSLTVEIEVGDAIMHMIAWERLFPETASKEYTDAMNAYRRAQREVYYEMGLEPLVNGRYPKLNAEQREYYNKVMIKHSFVYYTTTLSYKDSKHSAVRTKSYKTLTPLDREAVLKKIGDATRTLGDVNISFKDTKVDGASRATSANVDTGNQPATSNVGSPL